MGICVDYLSGWSDFSGDGDGYYIETEFNFGFTGYGYGTCNSPGSLHNYGCGDGWCFGYGNPDCTGGE